MSNGVGAKTAYAPGPLQECWLRPGKSGQLEGPYTFWIAENRARVATREAARTGNGHISLELVQYVGSRQGDPHITPVLMVVCVYLAGRKTQGGSLARYNSSQGNT